LFSTAAEEAYSTYQMNGNGDLWPSCWAEDGNLYAANGDGTNFATTFYPMAVGRISGTPPNLTGTFVAGDVGNNYSGSPYTDKPTGMLCVNGTIYLAYQNLNENTFEDAPAASIVESTDHGVTWSQNPATPMFGTPGDSANPLAYKFTTIFFLDYGQNYNNAIDGYVYAYGLDNDWRDQTAVYLARVPSTSVLDRSTWQFFAGMNGNTSTWTSDITQKLAVLTDERELYQTMFGADCPANQKVVAQGGAVYDQPLNRYLMVTWGCATHEFYEAPQPWGPWSLFLSNDFGPLRLTDNRGQYGTSIPSKFISSDGKTLYLQSNVCCSGDSYTFSLRKVFLDTYTAASPTNTSSARDLALEPGTRAISKSTHFGTLCALNCTDQMANGPAGSSEDDWDEEVKTLDWWGYTWPQPYNMNEVVYATGTMLSNGGWYSADLRVQVRQNFQWVDVAAVTMAPPYPYNSQAGSQTAYTFNFPATWGDGVRIIGTPGGSAYFTSIGRLAVYYTNSAVTAGFAIGATPSTLSIKAGATGTATITVTPINGFNQQVTFTCSGLPSESACSFSPSSVIPDGSAASTTTITITTTAPSYARNSIPFTFLGEGSLLAFCFVLLLRGRKTFFRLLPLLMLALAFIAFEITGGCGSGSGNNSVSSTPGTPTGTSTVTITATSGSGSSAISQTASLQLVIQ
jgi:hypothetical protein